MQKNGKENDTEKGMSYSMVFQAVFSQSGLYFFKTLSLVFYLGIRASRFPLRSRARDGDVRTALRRRLQAAPDTLFQDLFRLPIPLAVSAALFHQSAFEC